MPEGHLTYDEVVDRFGDPSLVICAHIPADPLTFAEMLFQLKPDAPIPGVLPGSIVGECQSCGMEVVVGPAIQSMVLELDIRGKAFLRLCWLCVNQYARDHPDAFSASLTAGGVARRIRDLFKD
jgi:hypothetical protein